MIMRGTYNKPNFTKFKVKKEEMSHYYWADKNGEEVLIIQI